MQNDNEFLISALEVLKATTEAASEKLREAIANAADTVSLAILHAAGRLSPDAKTHLAESLGLPLGDL